MKKTLIKASLLSAIFALTFTSCEKESDASITGTSNPDNVVVDDMDRTGGTALPDGIIPDQYIVTLDKSAINIPSLGVLDYEAKTGLAIAQIESLLKNAGLEDVKLQNVYSTALVGFAAKLNADQINKLNSLSVVKLIEADKLFKVKGELVKVNSKSTNFTKAQSTPYGIVRVGQGNGQGKRAFVLDTGVDTDHPDLNVNTGLSKSFISSPTGNCGLLGILFGCPDGAEPSVEDGHGHGTHVSGTIAALDNGTGVIGVAAGAEVVGIKVLSDQGSGATSGIVQGVDYVASVGSPGDVANLSLGGGTSSSLDNAVINLGSKGIFVALAAGNESQNANNVSPARANGTNVYTVSAMDSQDKFASYSNFANPPVDFCAPGSSVQSTYKNGGYSTMSGTSMASPHMAGILLMTGGNAQTDGKVKNDPDGNADNIAHL
jgi:subtilisin family serine protease